MDSLSYAEKNHLLYERQEHMLEEFLKRGAISQQQYEKSLHDLTEKMSPYLARYKPWRTYMLKVVK